MATDYDYQLNPPKKVKQKKYATCWAAAFECLLDACAVSNKQTEDELVAEYGNAQVGGGIRPVDLETVARKFGFLFNTFLDKDDAVVFKDSFVMERLKQSGPVLAAPRVTSAVAGGAWYHAQVIWGVQYSIKADIGTNLALLNTMNPADGNYALFPISYFSGNTPMFTCWKNAGGGSQ